MFIGAVVFSTTLFAQEATGVENPWTLEGAINYNSTDGLVFSSPSVRARYFVMDNIAIRADLGLGMDSQTDDFYENMDGSGGKGSISTDNMSWALTLGGEYHLGGTEKLSPYFSAGLMFGGGSSGMTSTDVDDIDPSVAVYTAGISTKGDQSMSMMGFGIGAGMDYYVWNNVYVGLELGISYGKTTYGDATGSMTMDIGGTPTTTSYTIAGSSSTSMASGAGSIRLGWRF